MADNVLRIAMDVGEGLLKSGAEVHRVEFTIEKICKTYGAAHVEVFSIHSLIVAAVRMTDGSYSSQTRRILDVSNQLLCLEAYNALSRKICAEKPDFDTADKLIRETKKKRKYPFWLVLIGHILTAGSFAVFFGGTILDGIAAALVGGIIAFLAALRNDHFNIITKTLFLSFFAGLFSCLAVMIGLGENVDTIIIGTIMILVPGLSLGNAVRDLLYGDTLAGVLKTVQAVIIAGMIAIGYAIPRIIFNSLIPPSTAADFGKPHGTLIMIATALLGTIGFSFLFRISPKKLPMAAVGGTLTYAIYLALYLFGVGPLMIGFICAIFMAIFSEACARIFRAPSVVFLYPCVIPIMPGGSLYYTIYYLFNNNMPGFRNALQNTSGIILGIAIGLSLASVCLGLILQAITYFRSKIKGN